MKAAKKKPTKVRVTKKDMREGVGGDCWRCAVSLALHRATGDDHANVYRSDWILYVEVWSRSILAPDEVRLFVDAYDELERQEDKTPILPDPLPDDLQPFTFELPPSDSPEWQERCYGCESLFDDADLDDEGNCEECRKEADQ